MFQKITGCGHHKVLLICTYLRGMYRVYAAFPWRGYVRLRNINKHRHNHDYETQECFVRCTRAFGFGGGAVRRMRKMDF